MSAILTPPEVARRWKCSSESVLGLLKAGRLKGFSASPPTAKRPRWRVTLKAVEEFEAGKKPAAQESPSPSPSRRKLMSGIPSVY